MTHQSDAGDHTMWRMSDIEALIFMFTVAIAVASLALVTWH